MTVPCTVGRHVLIYGLFTALLLLNSALATRAKAQIAAPEVDPNHGKRAFVTSALTVPRHFHIESGKNPEYRTIPAGTVIKLSLINGATIGYDDFGVFLIEKGNFIPLSSNLPECLSSLVDESDFCKSFASGNYFANINRDKTQAHFKHALRMKPDDQRTLLGLALAQSNPKEKQKQLTDLNTSVDPDVSLMARAHLAVIGHDFKTIGLKEKQLAALIADERCPLWVQQEYIAHLLLHPNHTMTMSDLQPLLTKLMVYGPHPRSMNLFAMAYQSDHYAKDVPMQKRIDEVLANASQAVEMDPWFYHAHMTMAGLFRDSMRLGDAVEECEKALRQNPICLDAILSIHTLSAAARLLPDIKKSLSPKEKEGLKIGSHLLTGAPVDRLYQELKDAEDSDLPESGNLDFFIHGYVPVNHGGNQPKKIDLLKKRKATVAFAYLEKMGFSTK